MIGRRLLAVVLVLLVLAGCAKADPPPAEIPDDQPPGQVLSRSSASHSYPALVALTQNVFEIRYRSTSFNGSASTVSGVVFVPPGQPPPGGWPIASIGHPTTGVTTECAPSSYPALLGGVPAVAQFLASGFVVALTDYRGLGMPGPHPYLDPITAAYNMIDAARAARQLVPEASDTWVTYGVSQGAQAAWAANEVSQDYGAGLRLIGSVSIAPPTDLRPIVDAMEDGSITRSQMAVLPLILVGLRVAHPELDIDDYLHGIMRDRLDVFMKCAGEQDTLKELVVQSASPADVKPSTPEAADQLRTWLGEYSVPQRRAAAPMFVAYGDADDLVLPAWTEAGVRRACELGDVVEKVVAPGQGHGTLDLGSAPRDWVEGRLAGAPAPNTC
ncbi:hypothetical protein A5740_17260 [Mycobacterium sp. GA-1841]|uniref:lipase family protein n=1 Tax=Mycobacterium sp. GA-1841 TaxID=1834154 RepID=UPI00096F10DC|nr:lipase family protein [Mycobacterium sp. GA-1841]OMC29663.1 hypothetical protein A5740_17260 [Mycobacterium sp. GA-1841]